MTVTQGIDFGSLSLKDAMDLAVLVEEEARDRYEELAVQLTVHHTPAAAAFFTRMSRIEEIHRKILEDKRKAEFGKEPSTISSSNLFDIEAPEYDEARAFMTVKQALEVSLHSEIKAHDFFARAAEQVKDATVRELFETLRDEEIEHQKLVRAELAKLGTEPEGSAEPYSDEPNPQ